MYSLLLKLKTHIIVYKQNKHCLLHLLTNYYKQMNKNLKYVKNKITPYKKPIFTT